MIAFESTFLGPSISNNTGEEDRFYGLKHCDLPKRGAKDPGDKDAQTFWLQGHGGLARRLSIKHVFCPRPIGG